MYDELFNYFNLILIIFIILAMNIGVNFSRTTQNPGNHGVEHPEDVGDALILTSYIESGDIETVRD